MLIKTLVKRVALTLLVAAVALTWSDAGNTQGPCVVERGIDPLDVLNQTVRHNVWVVLDTSGSMANDFGGGKTRIQAAKDVLNRLIMSELVDAQGNPLVNWGFVHFDYNNRDTNTACSSQFANRCVGLDLNNLLNPPACGGTDNRAQVVSEINGAPASGWTPNGISLDQISNEIVNNNYVSGLFENQRNFIIMVTDGDDTCECGSNEWENWNTWARLRSNDTNWDFGNRTWNDDDVRAFNAGLKGRLAYERLNPTAASRADGALGGTFVIGMGLGTSGRARANHLSWEASGASYGNPNAQSALFANNEQELIDALKDAFAKIGIPDTEVKLGVPVVGSVPELIPEIEGPPKIQDPVTSNIRDVTVNDIVADMANPDILEVNFVRKVRHQLSDNVVFDTSVKMPGFKGHLKAYNAYRVVGGHVPDTLTKEFDDRDPDAKMFWDAGELLRDRHPDDRTILFNLADDNPGTAPIQFRTGDDPLASHGLSNDQLADLLGVDVGYLKEVDGVGALTKADAAKMAIQVIRGWRLSVHPLTSTLYRPPSEVGLPGYPLNLSTTESDGVTNTWKLLDPSNVGPAVVQSPPRSPDAEPPQFGDFEFGTSNFPYGFYWRHINRQTMIYLPTNGGMVHAFRGDNGAEIFGYIPADVLGDWKNGEVANSRNTLKDLVRLIVTENNGIQNHKFLLSASVNVEDVFLRSPIWDDDWHTAIIFGRGKGGKFLTALDVSDMPDWDQNTANIDRMDPNFDTLPKLIFNVGNRQGLDDRDAYGGSYDGLGETWSVPVIGNVKAASEDQWVAFAGAGYGCRDSGTNEGQYLYVLKMEDGSVYRRFQVPNDPNAPIDYNGLVATPKAYNGFLEDWDAPFDPSEDFTTRVYIGDLQGKVHKLNCNESNPANWTFTTNAGTEFFDLGTDQPITTMIETYRHNTDVYILVGTGGDQRANSTFQFAALLDENDSNQGILVWSYELPDGERVFASPVVGGDIVFFASSVQALNANTCTIDYSSTLFALGVESGMAAFDLDTGQSGDQESASLGDGKVTGLYVSDALLYVSQSGGVKSDGSTLVLGNTGGSWESGDAASVAGGTIQLFVRGFRMSPF